MNDTIKSQIQEVRTIGEANMLDTEAVMVIANREGFYELVCYILDYKREYSRFIVKGDTN
jgi:hypothetical protein